MSDPDLLDWTISDAPAPDEAPLPDEPRAPLRPPPAPPPRRPLPGWTWLLLGTVIVLAVLVSAFGLPALERYRARRAVEAVVAQEAAAIEAGDWDALRALYDPTLGYWATSEIQLIKQGAMPPLLWPYGMRAAEVPSQVRAVTVLDPKLAKVEVERIYAVPDGTRVTLTLPQFYRYAEEGWVRTEPPKAWWGEPQTYHGARVDLDYNSVDAAYAVDLGRFLDGLMGRACQQWQCPVEVRVWVDLASTVPDLYGNPWYSPLASLTFGFVSNTGGQDLNFRLGVPSPQLAGLPQDIPSLAATRRSIAVPVLVKVAQQAARPGAPPGAAGHFNAYFYALVVRELARLGQEEPALAQMRVANPVFISDELWALPIGDYQGLQGLSEALVVLNGLLEDEPPATEARLFQTLDTAPDLTTWLAGGLALSPDEVQSRVAAALNPPVPLLLSSLGDPDLALGCVNGLWLASLDGRAWPLTDGDYPNSFGVNWSPDGRRLAVNVAGRTALLDLAQPAAEWLPEPIDEFGSPVQWLDASTVAYEPRTYHVDTPSGYASPDFLGTRFYDAAHPDQPLAPLPTFSSYWLSPDRTLAVVGVSLAGGALSVIPASGGDPIGAGYGGQQVIWSSDSRRIASVLQSGLNADWSVLVMEATAFESRTILAGDDPRLPPPEASTQSSWVSLAWAPAGDELAVTLNNFQDFTTTGWVGIVRADGSEFHRLPLPDPGFSVYSASYSADGHYLAVNFRKGILESVTGIYDLADGTWPRLIPQAYGVAWSPTGHTLLLSGVDGTSRLSDPGNPDTQPLRLTSEQCYSVSWRP